MSAERLVDVGLSEDHKLVTLGKSMRVVCRASASDADCVYFLNVFRNSHERWHRTERLAEEVCVKTCDDHSDTSVCEGLYNLYDRLVKELSLIDSYNLYIRCDLQHAGRRVDGC